MIDFYVKMYSPLSEVSLRDISGMILFILTFQINRNNLFSLESSQKEINSDFNENTTYDDHRHLSLYDDSKTRLTLTTDVIAITEYNTITHWHLTLVFDKSLLNTGWQAWQQSNPPKQEHYKSMTWHPFGFPIPKIWKKPITIML